MALTAPTGKAAARMEEAVRAETARLDSTPTVRQLLYGLSGTTLHRLLGTRPDRPGQFRHHRTHHLPHEIVVVDEASMVSLSLMARLVEAVRPDARLILVGDPDQLVSVEAGAVLADIVGSAAGGPLAPPSEWAPGAARVLSGPAVPSAAPALSGVAAAPALSGLALTAVPPGPLGRLHQPVAYQPPLRWGAGQALRSGPGRRRAHHPVHP